MRTRLHLVPLLLLGAVPSWAQQLPLRMERQMLPPSEDLTHDIVCGDLDRDGDLDIVVANDGENRVLLNDGSGVFAAEANAFPPGSEQTLAIALGDLDGDGILDLVLANGGPALLGGGQPDRVLLGDGRGHFTELVGALPGPASPSTAVALADFDGDGHLDVLLTHGLDCTLFCRALPSSLFLGDGTGRFVDATATHLLGEPTLSQGSWTAVVCGDVDADGDVDAVIGGYGFYEGGFPSVLYRNDGAGHLVADAQGLPWFYESTLGLRLADIDGDGDLDLLEANGVPGGHGAPDRWVENDGSGNFTTDHFPWGSSGDVHEHAVGDIDGDGDLDLLAGENWSFYDPNPVFVNQGGGVMLRDGARLPPWVEATRAVELVDVDADGDLDALVFGLGPDHLHLNDGHGWFAEAGAGVPPRSSGSAAIGLGDLDADGVNDLLLLGSARWGIPRAPSVALRGLGDGTFESFAVPLPSELRDGSALELGDVDGDGDLDALLGLVQGPAALWLGDGAGGFAAAAGLPAGADDVDALALVDLDGDGILDALLASDDRVRFWSGRGDGSFADRSASVPTPSDRVVDLAVGDLDGDRDPDVVLAGGAPLRLLLGDGRGGWSLANAGLPPNAPGALQVELLDADGDGDLDLVWCDASAAYYASNDGAGRFTLSVGALPPLPGIVLLAVGDANSDGAPDLLLGRGPTSAPDPRVVLGDGLGGFSAPVALPVGNGALAAARLADLDGDGDTDVLLCSAAGPDRLYHGSAVNLAWRGLPRVGRELVLDLRGSPQAPWELVAALRETRVELPPYGSLRVEPSSIVAVSCGSFDAQGHAELRLRVPADPALVGARASWQFLDHGAARLSNLERTLVGSW